MKKKDPVLNKNISIESLFKFLRLEERELSKVTDTLINYGISNYVIDRPLMERIEYTKAALRKFCNNVYWDVSSKSRPKKKSS